LEQVLGSKVLLPKDLLWGFWRTIAEFTDRISNLRNKLGRAGLKDEGLVVPKELGAEGKIE
ncbi:Desiccation-related protein PCC13-62, partial [Trichinella patagoniensis]